MTVETTDQELLQRYAQARDEAALSQLVTRHLNLAVGTAFRILNDSALAQDAAQAAFIALAREAPSLTRHRTVEGWLHKTVVNRARALGRSEGRRRKREELAAQLSTAMSASDSLLSDLAPVLDDVLLELREADRRVLLLRFFESKSFQQVGAALGIQEDAAQKRVARALAALTERFRRRGFAAASGTVTVLALEKAAAMIPILPAGFPLAVAHAACLAGAGGMTGGSALLLAKLMTLTKMQTAVLCALIAAAPASFQWRELRRAEAQNRQTMEELTRLRADINERQRGIGALERRLRRTQAVEADGRQAGDTAPKAGTARGWYAWDEGSDFVRLPRQYAGHFRYAEFDTRTVARRDEREQRQPIARDGTPSPVLLDALGVNEPTRAQLSEALQDACAQAQSLAAGQSYLTNRQPLESRESVTLRTEASPAEAATLKEGLRGSLVNLLGEERAELVMQEGAQVFHDAWSDFGASPHEVTIWPAADGSVQAREDLYDANGALRASRSGDASSGFVQIPLQLQPYVDAWKQAAQARPQNQPGP